MAQRYRLISQLGSGAMATVFLARHVVGVKYITLVNLLANEELFPELLTARDESDRIAGHLLGWLTDPSKRAALVGRLEALRAKVAVPGACERASRRHSSPIVSRRAAGSRSMCKRRMPSVFLPIRRSRSS